jgi:TetR/AcrR family transcriptional regulator, transcriptional repressor for nem operon
MSDSETSTRDKLLDAAAELILRHGLAGASVAMIVERAGVTKGSFFYYFDSKTELAHEVIERNASTDKMLLAQKMRQAESLSRDPHQQLLLFVGLLREAIGPHGEPPPGCLFASYAYQAELFDQKTRAVVAEVMLAWREALVAKLEEVAAQHPPRLPVELEDVADSAMTSFEGALVVARILDDPSILAAQLTQLRNYLELLFAAQPPTSKGEP